MKKGTGFWFGMGAGVMAGRTVGMIGTRGQRPMTTQEGQRIQKMGVAVDHTLDNLMSDLH